MGVTRRTAIKAGGPAVLLGTVPMAMAEPANQLASSISADGKSIKVVRIFIQDGQTKIAETELHADYSPYPLFKQFLTHKATATAIYRAPPHHKIEGRATTAKELLFLVSGETSFETTAGKRRCGAGTVVISESGSGEGLREQAGADGYIAVKVQLAD